MVHAPGLPEPIEGREALQEFVQGYYAAFPDLNSTTERIFGQDDWVITEDALTGTHTGPMRTPTGEEIPPTNKPIQIKQAVVLQVENGEIQQVHLYFDQLGMMAQLGLAPSE